MIVDSKGRAVGYDVNKDGSLKWSKNATADIKRIGNAMAKTDVGLKALSSLKDSKVQVTMKLDSKNVIVEKSGATRLGYTQPTATDGKGNVTKTTLTVYEKGIEKMSNSTVEKPSTTINLNNTPINLSNYTKEEIIGATATHEEPHNTDKNSRSFTNPNATSDEIESTPRANELQYYQQIDEKKK